MNLFVEEVGKVLVFDGLAELLLGVNALVALVFLLTEGSLFRNWKSLLLGFSVDEEVLLFEGLGFGVVGYRWLDLGELLLFVEVELLGK